MGLLSFFNLLKKRGTEVSVTFIYTICKASSGSILKYLSQSYQFNSQHHVFVSVVLLVIFIIITVTDCLLIVSTLFHISDKSLLNKTNLLAERTDIFHCLNLHCKSIKV